MAKRPKKATSKPAEQQGGLFPVNREKVAYSFQIERGRLDALRLLAVEDGVSASHLIRQAVNELLRARGRYE